MSAGSSSKPEKKGVTPKISTNLQVTLYTFVCSSASITSVDLCSHSLAQAQTSTQFMPLCYISAKKKIDLQQACVFNDLLRATRGARNPNLNDYITNACATVM